MLHRRTGKESVSLDPSPGHRAGSGPYRVPVGRRSLRARVRRVIVGLLCFAVLAGLLYEAISLFVSLGGDSGGKPNGKRPGSVSSTSREPKQTEKQEDQKPQKKATKAPKTTKDPYARRNADLFQKDDHRTQVPATPVPDVFNQRYEGELQPEEPERLPGLTVLPPRKHTPEELLQMYADMDFVYSFINGSEPNTVYIKSFINTCGGHRVVWWPGAAEQQASVPLCLPRVVSAAVETHTEPLTNAELLAVLRVTKTSDNRDRDLDELRYSVRSLDAHVRWHRGRVLIVSPGHGPHWASAAGDFMAKTGEGRLTVVHQDVVLPEGLRVTINSHNIEPQLWRLRGLTAMHLYLNDDYYINRDLHITDLFNPYGGAVIRTEKGILAKPASADKPSNSWIGGVHNTEHFNTLELDIYREDYVPPTQLLRWAAEGVPEPNLSTAIAAAAFPPEPRRGKLEQGRRLRHFTTHAPFVYCTNMHRFFNVRYDREIMSAAVHLPGRSAQNLLVPFLYNGFAMARPWVASPGFPRYLLDLHKARRHRTPPPELTIALDNKDGCAPATQLSGFVASQAAFGKIYDSEEKRNEFFSRVNRTDEVLYFNLNAMCDAPKCVEPTIAFLRSRFPLESRAERHPDALTVATFDRYMALPVVLLLAEPDGVCGLVRSLALALRGHTGVVVVVLTRAKGAPARVVPRAASAMPVTACQFSRSRVRVVAAPGADLARAVEAAGVAAAGGEALVVDARPVGEGDAPLAALGQTLALEDFARVQVSVRAGRPSGDGNTTAGDRVGAEVLVLTRATEKVNWVTANRESELLVTFPLPTCYEDMAAAVKWIDPMDNETSSISVEPVVPDEL